ncbi:MAG: hypothetical protein WAU95_18350, partial [Anaerolineae bacterium]
MLLIVVHLLARLALRGNGQESNPEITPCQTSLWVNNTNNRSTRQGANPGWCVERLSNAGVYMPPKMKESCLKRWFDRVIRECPT